ncbi:MAG: hypothetical protein KAW56_04710 [Candidatus Marinimicrobia bacterium]|nr:hypothetical protein [Candidatus Neomarinimicrobiota bacterium]
MSVIPLIVEGPNRTVVEHQSEFDSVGGISGNVLLVQGLDHNQLCDPNETNVSYDLRVGNEYRDHRNIGKNNLQEGDFIEFLPGSAVIIETEEFVHFPNSAFGYIVPKVSLLQKGISNTPSKVDPGYKGKLLITVFNLGKKNVKLKRGERFCSLHIVKVLEGARPYDKAPKSIVGAAKRKIWQKIRDILEANNVLVMLVLIIVTLILIIVQIIQLIQ